MKTREQPRMDKEELLLNDGVDIYDGYKDESIWTMPSNYSTYCNNEVDSQCIVPIQSCKEEK